MQDSSTPTLPAQRKHFLSAWFAIPLWKRVMAGLALGVIVGLAWPTPTPTARRKSARA